MRLSQFLVLNRKVELEREDDPVAYKSLIQAVGEDNFGIAVPSFRSERLILHPGDQVKLKVFGDNEQFFFATKVLGRKMEQIPLYFLAKPNQVQRIQLRDYVRLKTALEVFYQVINREEVDRIHLLNPAKRAITVDISGGGLQLAVEEEFRQGDLLYLKLLLPGNGQQAVFAVGIVKRFLPAGDLQPKNQIGIHFEMIAERDRDLLIGYIFNRMRKQRWLER